MIELFTVEQAAARLRISKSLLHHLTAARRICFVRLGRRVYFSFEDLEVYSSSRRVEPVAAADRK